MKSLISPRLIAGVTIALVLSFAVLAICTLSEWMTLDRGMVIHRLDSESSRLASTLFFEKMTALAQLTVGLLGAAWAFVTLVDTQVRIKGWPVVTCFVLANLSLVISLAVYVHGHDFIVARIFHHATFDIDAPFSSWTNIFQQWWFLSGVIAIGLTILFGRGAK